MLVLSGLLKLLAPHLCEKVNVTVALKEKHQWIYVANAVQKHQIDVEVLLRGNFDPLESIVSSF